MTATQIVLLVFFGFPLLLVLGFGALSVGRRWLKDPECPAWLRVALYLVVAAFWITDPLFNWTWGALIFRKGLLVPTWRKVTYSSRIGFYFEHRDECPNLRKRNLWARLLNMGVEGHIDTHGEDISPGAAVRSPAR
jgi:hypothetical protein